MVYPTGTDQPPNIQGTPQRRRNRPPPDGRYTNDSNLAKGGSVGRDCEAATPWSLAQREGAHTGSRTRDLILTKNALYLY